MPHFELTTLDGSHASYGDIWQRKNLLLVVLPAEDSAERAEYIAALDAVTRELAAYETECLTTADDVLGVPQSAIVIADRWGEIYFVDGGRPIADLPKIDALVEWLRFIAHECPECQGETR